MAVVDLPHWGEAHANLRHRRPFGTKEALGREVLVKIHKLIPIYHHVVKPVVEGCFSGLSEESPLFSSPSIFITLYFHQPTNGKRSSMLMIIFSIDGGFLQWRSMEYPKLAGWCWMVYFIGKMLPKWMMTGSTTILGNLHILVYIYIIILYYIMLYYIIFMIYHDWLDETKIRIWALRFSFEWASNGSNDGEVLQPCWTWSAQDESSTNRAVQHHIYINK